MSAAPPGENPATVETPVDIAKLKSALGCPMCGEMFNFPVTVIECLHTFCHACIVKEVQPGKPANACPKCKIALGNNPFVEKKIVKDAPKTGLVDKLRSAGKCLSAEEQSAWDAKAAAAAAAAATTTTG